MRTLHRSGLLKRSTALTIAFTLLALHLLILTHNPAGAEQDSNEVTVETYLDEFATVSYDNTNGTRNWNTTWTEIGETDGPTTGHTQIITNNTCPTGCLQIQASPSDTVGIARLINLNNSRTAQLTIHYTTTPTTTETPATSTTVTTDPAIPATTSTSSTTGSVASISPGGAEAPPPATPSETTTTQPAPPPTTTTTTPEPLPDPDPDPGPEPEVAAEFTVAVSPDNGGTWVLLDTLTPSNATATLQLDITPLATPETIIRVTTHSTTNQTDSLLLIDDIEIATTAKAPAAPVKSAAEWRNSLPPDSPDLPLTFEQNTGQADPTLDFIARGKGYIVTLTEGAAVLSLGNGNSPHDIQMTFPNGAPDPQPVGSNADPAPSDTPRYASVQYNDLYPGIDIVYSANGRELEYSFIVNPGANPADITVNFEGANKIIVEDDGTLLVDSRAGRNLIATAPYTYQTINSVHTPIDSAYRLNPNNTIGFTLGTYDPNYPLTIDPTFKSAAGANSGGTNTVTITQPAGLQADDVMLASIAQPANSAVTPPAGWVLIRTDSQSGEIRQDLFYKVATASEPASYSFTLGTVDFSAGAIAAYSGVDTASPIDAHGGQGNGESSNITAPSITTTVAGTTLVGFFANLSGGSIAPPAGMTERADQGSVDAVTEIADELLGAAGATGSRTATGSATSNVGQLVALKPAPAACTDSDGDGLCDLEEDANTDADNDPATNPGPNTDGDANPNYLDADDDGDGTTTASENADPNGDGDPRDALDSDRDGQPDYLDLPTGVSNGTVGTEQKISDLVGGLAATLSDDDLFGRAVASIGDLDGDGVVDIAVGAQQDDDGGLDRGAVYVLFLNANGTVKGEQKISDTAGGFAAVLDNDDQFGSGVAGIGDLDGDGINDIAVGAQFDDDGGADRGAVYVLFLNANGTVRGEQKISDTAGGFAAVLDNDDELGRATAGIGDLDGDGLNDLVVGAFLDDDGGLDRGAVYVLFLNANGTVKGEQKISDTAGGFAAVLDNVDRFGSGVAGIGDLDGDGLNDIAIGAMLDDDGGNNRGAAYILFLNANGTVKGEQKISDTVGGLTASLADTDRFGRSIGGAGDIDGDGNADVVVGAPNDGDGGADHGATYVLFLNANGTVKGEQKISDTAGGLTTALDDNDQFGSAPAGIGDINGDGRIDLAVGAFRDDDGGLDHGAVYVLHLAGPCADSDSDGLCDLEEDANTDLDNDPATNPGPDTDGDANPNYLDADDDGDGTPTASENADPNGDGDPRDALDSDHDGQPDYLDLPTTASSGLVDSEQKISDIAGGLTATLDDADTFGSSVAGIGDLDDDGINDVAVGAHYDGDGGTYRGAVYVLFLNANGTVKAEQKISDTVGGLTATLDDFDRFGISVTAIGDLDGDGINDIAVGAQRDDDGGTDRGAVHILFLNTDGTVKAEQKISDTVGGLAATLDDLDRFGTSVTAIGDLDGDGINDIAVGAHFDDDGGSNRGAVYVLLLNADGTVKAEQKISDTAGGLVAPLSNTSLFGNAVSGIGDLDGDGILDLAVGAPEDDDGGSNRGAVYVLFLNADGTVKAEQKISDTAGGLTAAIANSDLFGTSVSGIGDLDDDGVADLAVGAIFDDDGGTDRGAVHVLFLNANGTVKAERKISDVEGGLAATLDDADRFGHSLAGVGDLDGDGLIDLAVGALFDDDGGADRGAVYVLHLAAPCADSDGDGLCDLEEDANTDADNDPATNPGPDTDGDANPNYLDADDDGDGTPTASENADPNADGDPRDAKDSDRDGQPDYLDLPTGASGGTVDSEQKISDTAGGLAAILNDDDRFGRSVAGVGDIDGDGINDIAVGAPRDDDGGSNRGAVHILFLNAGGTVKAEQKISDIAGGFAATLDNDDRFGTSVAGIGDLDGDGINDIAVGVMLDDDGGADRGAVHILFLNANGTVKAEQKISDIAGGFAATLDNDDRFGTSVAGIGDLDGDGINDIAVGVMLDDDGGADRGAVHILFLNADGTVKAEQKISDIAGGFAATLDNDDRFGRKVAGIGDLDGDGLNDIIVSAPRDDDGGADRGAVHILFLNANGTVKAEQRISDTAGGLTASLDNDDRFGQSVAGIGDVDADGINDIVVSASFDDDGGTDRGAVHILFLNANGTVKAEQKISDTAGGLTAALDDADEFGVGVAGVGDLDGDGTIDIAVGVHTDDDGGTDRGAVYVLHLAGPCADSDGDGLCDLEEDANTDADNDPATNPGPNTDGDANPNYLDADDDGDGTPTASENADPNSDGDPRDAQDADRDGQPDYLDLPTGASGGTVDSEQKISDLVGGLGAVLDDGDSFGRSVAGIGDVDGDGIIDVAVGAADDDGGPNRGAVYVLFLNADGTVKAEQKISDLVGGLAAVLDDSDYFGTSVAGIGDVDGDGIIDMAVGAGDDDGGPNRGAVYVLFLNADGTVKAEQKISDLAGGLTAVLDDGDYFGHSVAGIGDVDGDGVNDIAVGAINDDDGGTNRGAVYVLFLNADGTVKAEQKISDLVGGLTAVLDNGDFFGHSVAGIGDVDGDGIIDVAVGAGDDDDGGIARGAVYVLFLNADGTVKAEQKISDLVGGLTAVLDDVDYFGASVAGIGDVDGDGIIDMAVGANMDDDGGPNRGAVYVLFLNADGTVKAEQKISDLVGGLTAVLDDVDYFGASVAGIGDVGGDGVIDLLVGTHADDDGGVNHGAVYILNLAAPCADSDSDGLCDLEEDANTDLDNDPATNPGPDTDGDTFPNYLDADDDGDGAPTASENADPNSDGDPRDAQDSDRDGQPDYLDLPTGASGGTVDSEQKISDTAGGLAAILNDDDRFGTSVAAIGDLDGDGINDIAEGTQYDDDGGSNRGAVHILFLNANGTVKAEQKISDTVGGLTATFDDSDLFGISVAGLGDIDGDGINDIGVGALNDDDGGTNRGAVHILFLNTDGTVKAEQKISDTAGGLTATLDDNDGFGMEVANIGDLDGDGINDIAVGAYQDDDGGADRGAMYVLFLNADGTVKAEQKISDTAGGFASTLNNTDLFGISLAAIGDLDGDSLMDIVVGAELDDDGGTDRGAAYVLFLNADGTVKAEQKISDITGGFTATLDDNDYFGNSVAGTGDLDDDGIEDIVVSAMFDDDGGTDRGAVHVLFLNTDGTVKAEQKISDTAGGFTATLDDSDRFGLSAAGIGDLGGDGLIDIAVGAHLDDDGGLDRGAVYVLQLAAPVTSNQAPTAVADSYSSPQYTVLNVPADGVLGNDTDPDGDTLSAELVTGPSNGSVTLNPDGSFEYTPDPGWSGTDNFTYRAVDMGSLSNALLLHVTLDETTGATVAVDFSGNSSDFAILNGTLIEQPGQIGTAFTFDGSNDALQSQSINILGAPTAATMSGWFKTTSAGTNDWIMDSEGAFIVRYDAGDITVAYDGSTGDSPVLATGLDDGLWHHFAALNNGTTTSLYIDGQFSGSDPEAITDLGTRTDESGIGAYYDAASRFFQGSIDDIAVWNRALTPAEITHVYASGVGGLSLRGEDTAVVTVTINPAAIVVNSTGDAVDNSAGDGVCDTGGVNSESATECTLRAAIEEANTLAGPDTINFSMPATEPGHSGGVWTIVPTSPYDDIIQTVSIDASTQPGFPGDPIVQLDGSHPGAAGATAALTLEANDSLIEGFIVHSWLDEGLEIDASTSKGDNNTIRNNWIGIDAAENLQSIGDVGILVTVGANDNTIEGNVVGGATNSGIVIRNLGSDNNIVIGNSIGVGPDGSSPISNGLHGIELSDQVAGNRIGGLGAEANVIANNSGDGVRVADTAGVNNSILGNSIHSNGGLGIDLDLDGVTANGAGDPLNFPVITTATESAGTISIDFDLDVPAGDYRIEFFTNTAADVPTGYGEGETFVDFYDVVAHPGGTASYSTSVAGSAGDIVTATATEDLGSSYGSTSEFSAAYTVTPFDVTPPVITLVGADPQTIEVGSPYAELGATALDNYDGDITGSIVVDATAVNTALLGSYLVTYDVVDSSGNPAVQVTRTVDVVDATAPVITLVGADPVSHEVGAVYIDAGATALDNYDGDITGSIVTVNPVNPFVLGSYTVTYDVDDSSGNPAVQVTRTVDVVDTTIPVITLLGADPVSVPLGSVYIDAGATATDNYDGDLTGSIVTVNPVNTAVLGPYVVTYNVDDSSGNPATEVTRTVNVVLDVVPPVITLVGANPQTIEVGAGYTELGATATDNIDGDISGAIVIDASAVNTSVLGSYVVTYDVDDSSGNPAVQVTRTVDVVDTTIPVITLLGADPVSVPLGSVYIDAGATATDNYDGDLTGSIVTVNPVNTAVLGPYVVTYNVTDASSNAAIEVTRTVNVVLDVVPPVITLVGANPQTIEVGAGYTELGATATDNIDGDISGAIVIDASAVNTSVLGSYVVTYDVDDSSGNPATQVTRTVDVVDTTIPVITLLGADPVSVPLGSVYIDAGATATDNYDGDLTGSIVTVNPVNTAVLGPYVVTYNVTDASSNAAIEVTRTVNVVLDVVPPVITLVGANPQTIEVGAGYTELGATATDNIDGDISGAIVIDASAVNTGLLGSYVVTYDVDDSSGNPAVQVTRTVDVVDTTIPVITLVGADPVSVPLGSVYIDAGATATDNYDGDLTGSIVTVNPVNTAVLGPYVVTYNVDDSSGNPAIEVTRTVNVVLDVVPPVITLVGANPQTIEVGAGYSELGATATDNIDGDISGAIVIDASAVNTSVLGSYVVTYDVDDSSGNPAVQVTRTVDVVDTTIPVITLLGADPVSVPLGSVYIDAGATATDNYDGDLTGSIVTVNPVNTAVLGPYVVTYNVTDASSNAAIEVTRTVNVVLDVVPPVITLVGANPQTIEVGAGYSELGATATDNIDGDISGAIVIDASAVNTSVLGSYVVTYNVDDSSGNPAVQVTRTVDVVDTTIPVITLLGADPQVIEVGAGYTELGATATDNVDGDLTGSIVIDATAVNTGLLGSYVVTYDVDDSSGNPAVQVTRTVDVVDTTIPVITLLGGDPQVIEVGAGYTELGATATDNYDGDITGSIVIDATAVNTGLLGSYVVTYDVDDSSGNPAVQVTRTVDIVDTTAPVITRLGAAPVTHEVGGVYIDAGATATDNYDGDITGSIVTVNPVNPFVLGSYVVTYDVTDASGNPATQVTRTVDVVDTTAPVITLVGADPQTIEVGAGYSELGATAVDNYDGDITGSIVIDASAVNTAVLGSYAVTYDVDDSSGNPAVRVTRTVDVVDTTIPVITLVGANPQTIEVSSPYVELGATATDNYDGDITGSITIDTTGVNTAIVGSYVVTYDVTDSSGNPAVQVTRTIDVVDTAIPVITLVGADPQTLEVGSPYVELGATALDNYDGDITGSITIDASAVDTSVLGSYVVSYDVVDSSGNPATQGTRTVNVVDTTIPVITLVGADPQTIEVGSPYSELGATAADNYDGDISGSIVIDASAVNTSVLGPYVVSYDVVDSSGNPAAQVTRTVDVVDTTIPVITLVGADPQTIEIDNPYTELGATATDNYDGDLTGSIVVDATSVDTSIVGSYPVSYDVTDSSGNPAVQITRTVEVNDTNDPPLLNAVAAFTVPEGTTVTFTATATDPEGDTVTYGLVDAPSGASIDPLSGAFSWATGESYGPGSYVFTLTATDDGTPVLSSGITVTVNVTELNTAPVIDAISDQTSFEDDTVTLSLTGSDIDRPANTLTWSAIGLPDDVTIDAATGTISGSISATAAAGSPYLVTVSLRDDGSPSLSGQATFVWTIVETPNVAPNAIDDTYMVSLGATLTIPAPGVLGNDTDPNGDTLTATLATAPASGSLTLNPDGSFTYTTSDIPTDHVTFTYHVDDGHGGSATATVTITIEANQAPVAEPDYRSLETYFSVTIDVLANDSDPESDALTIDRVIAGDIEGSIAIDTATNMIIYQPRSGFIGIETFSYVVIDSNNNPATAQVTIEIVEAVNIAAVAITEALGTPDLPFESPPSDVAIASIGLEIGSVTLVADAFFQSIEALRVPLAFLVFSVLAVIILSGVTELPILIAGRRRKYWSVILLNREATLPVRAVASYDADVIYRYAPTATGIISLDKPEGTFLAIDTPRGTGYIDTAYLTTAVDLDHFLEDARPVQIVDQLTTALQDGTDITRYISPRGLIIAVADKPLLISPKHLIGTLKETNAPTETAAVALQIDLFEELRHTLLNTPTIDHNIAHSRSSLIPTELWNFPYLAVQAPGHTPWLIHFEYHNNKPHIAAISLDQ